MYCVTLQETIDLRLPCDQFNNKQGDYIRVPRGNEVKFLKEVPDQDVYIVSWTSKFSETYVGTFPLTRAKEMLVEVLEQEKKDLEITMLIQEIRDAGIL